MFQAISWIRQDSKLACSNLTNIRYRTFNSISFWWKSYRYWTISSSDCCREKFFLTFIFLRIFLNLEIFKAWLGCLCLQTPRMNSCLERFKIKFHLIRVALCISYQRIIKLVFWSQIPRYHFCVSNLCMGSCQSPTAHCCVT